MTKRLIIAILAMFAVSAAFAKERVVFMPQWRPQAQFVGYYVAFEKGFYSEEDLDVVIKHPSMSSKKSSIEYMVSGEADIVTAQFISAIIAKDAGVDLANILQTSQQSALCCISHRPLQDFDDFNGLSVSRWNVGFSELASLMKKEQNLDIEWVNMQNPLNCYIYGASDAMLAMSYNEYYQLLLSIGKIPAENVFYFSDHGYNFPEDGVYAMNSFCQKHPSIVASFNRASIKGWQYAAENPEEAMEILMKYMKVEKVASSYILQKFMLDEILDLQLDGKRKRSFEPISKDCYKEFAVRAKAAGIINTIPAYSKFFLQ